MSRDLQQTHDRWNELGDLDPLWSVLTDSAKSGRRWSEEEFFASGRADVQGLLADLAGAGIALRFGRAIDFGCGVGRLTQALAEHFEAVIGIDVAPSMIESARTFDRSAGKAIYVLNASDRLDAIESSSADLVYSSIVLQHIPPRLSKGYIAEFVRVLRPGGIAVFGLPTRPKRLRGHLKLWLKQLPRPVLGAILALARGGRTVPIDMYGVPRGDVESIVAAQGGEVISIVENDAAGPDWTNLRYTFRRSANA